MHVFAPNHVYMLVILQLESRNTRQMFPDRVYCEQTITVTMYEGNRSCDILRWIPVDLCVVVISVKWGKPSVLHDLCPVDD